MTQTARPASTISAGGWTSSSGGTLHGDQSDNSDTTYGRCSSTATTEELLLASLSDPNSSSNHVVTVRARATGSSGGEKLSAYLYQGSTLVATLFSASTITRNSWNNYTYTLSAAEADAITNYADLRVRCTKATLGSGEYLDVSDIWMVCPDAIVSLTPGAATHNHNADNPALSQHQILAVDGATHPHLANQPALTAQSPTFTLTVENASHTHGAGTPAITAYLPAVQLTASNASHTQLADNVTVTAHLPNWALTVGNASHAHVASEPLLIQHQILSPQAASDAHGSGISTAHAAPDRWNAKCDPCAWQ